MSFLFLAQFLETRKVVENHNNNPTTIGAITSVISITINTTTIPKNLQTFFGISTGALS